MPPTNAMIIIFSFFAFMLGACIGSFINVCILRIPRRMSLSYPPSHCFHCGTPLSFENLPILGYLFLKGKCKYCQSTFSIQYAGVELFCALLGLLSFLILKPNQISNQIDWQLVPLVSACLAIMVIATFIDLKWSIIPDRLTIGFCITVPLYYLVTGPIGSLSTFIIFPKNLDFFVYLSSGLISIFWVYIPLKNYEKKPRNEDLYYALFGSVHILVLLFYIFLKNPQITVNFQYYLQSIWGAFLSYSIIKVLSLPSIFIKKDIIGQGDLKLYTLLGAILGLPKVLIIIVLSIVLSAIIGSFIILFSAIKSKANPKDIGTATLMLVLMTICFCLLIFHIFSPLGLSAKLVMALYFISIFSLFGFLIISKKWLKSGIAPTGIPMAPYICSATIAVLLFLHDSILPAFYFSKLL